MGCQNEFRILAEGLRNFITQFKNVEFDLTPEEKKTQTAAFEYKAEPKKLNSAEEYNLEVRNKYAVKSYDFDEFQVTYRTGKYKYDRMVESINIIKYLLSVLDLAEIVNNGIEKACSEAKEIRKNKNLTKDEIQYQTIKNTVNCYLDALIEVKTRKDDFYYSNYSHYFRKSYEELDSYSRLIMTGHAIPDEMSVSFNALYDGIPLNKFSAQKDLGVSKAMCMTSFSQFADKLYTIIHIFLSNLINEFSAYVTSDVFLNNPEGKANFIIPLNMYKKFNFQRSGLTRQEIVFIDIPNDPAKTAANFGNFIAEVRESLMEFHDRASKLKADMLKKPDSKELEWFLDKYAALFEGTTDGRINKIQALCKKSSAFREKLTCMLYEIQSDLVEVLTVNGNPWEIENEPTKELKNFDKDTCHFIGILCRTYFGDAEIPNAQFQRIFNLFTYRVDPIKAMCVQMKKSDWTERWSSDRKDDFTSLLYR